MFEEFDNIEDARIRAKIIYSNIVFELSLGCPWLKNGYIVYENNKYKLITDK